MTDFGLPGAGGLSGFRRPSGAVPGVGGAGRLPADPGRARRPASPVPGLPDAGVHRHSAPQGPWATPPRTAGSAPGTPNNWGRDHDDRTGSLDDQGPRADGPEGFGPTASRYAAGDGRPGGPFGDLRHLPRPLAEAAGRRAVHDAGGDPRTSRRSGTSDTRPAGRRGGRDKRGRRGRGNRDNGHVSDRPEGSDGSDGGRGRRGRSDAGQDQGRKGRSRHTNRATGTATRTATSANAGARSRAATRAERRREARGFDLREAVTVGLWLTIGLVVAWVVLVVVRSPRAGDGDALAARIDLVIAETLLAERVESFAYWICSVCTLLVIGGAIFRFFVVPPHVGVLGTDGALRAQSRRPGGGNAADGTLRGAAVVGMVAAAFLVPLRTIALSGGRFSEVTDTDALWFVLNSRFGDSAVLRIAGLSILLLALADGPRLWRGGSARAGRAGRGTIVRRATRRKLVFAAGTIVVLLGYAMVGHPQATNPWIVHVAAQWIHITVAAAWFGGVTFLGIELRQQWRRGSARYTGEVVGRFSSLAEVTIIVAAVTGVLLANSQIHDPTAVLQSAYGRAFVGKMIALGVVLAIGGYNQQRLVPAIVERDEEAAWDHLRRALVLEVTLIALGVLLMTAAMTSGGI